MSLASFLLGTSKKQPIDKELDDLIKSQVGEDRPSSTTRVASNENKNEKKRKSKKHEEEHKKKRRKSSDAGVNEETITHDKKARKARRKVVEGDLDSDVEMDKAESSKVSNGGRLAADGEDGPSSTTHVTSNDSNKKKRESKKHDEERKKKRPKSDAEVNEKEIVAHDKKARKASRKVVEADLDSDVEADKGECSKVSNGGRLAADGEDGPSSTIHVTSNDSNKKKRKSKKHDEERKKKRPKSSDAGVDEETAAHDKKARKASRKVVEADLDSDIEADKAESSKVSMGGSLATDGEDSDDPSHLVHETLHRDGSSSQKGEGKKKYVPADETQEQRDARTIFIGNIPPEVAQKRPLQKRLRQHVLASVPTAKIESMRFRSIPFQIPTSNLSLSQDPSDDKKKKGRQHDRDRAASWREANPNDDDTPKIDAKKFLTPSQKKKIAFINDHIHSSADSVHAYVVFAYPKPPELWPANLPPPPPVMDPFEAARLAVEKCNGTIFMDRMIRVDSVGHSETSPNATTTATNLAIGDPKLTVFVGNLDFASKEDDLRVFFETLVHAERGPPPLPQDSGSDGTKHGSWVTRVRMIRDKDTQLGKGFAYVQFVDHSCVDEILALEPDRLKFAKRKLRVHRCKMIPSSVTPAASSSSKPPRIHTGSSISIAVPKGDPSLGEKLAHLSKEERKQVKAADADRRERRLAKKKARMALDKQGVRHQGKGRERVRKSVTARKSGAAPARKTSKGRVRSEKSLSKRNAKK